MSRSLMRVFPVLLLLALTCAFSDSAAPVAAQESGVISGRVVNDVDHDGTAEADEPGLPGWLVTVESTGNEPLLRETRTDAEGRYLFRNVPLGDYDVTLPCDGQPSLWGGTSSEFTVYSIALQAGSPAEDGFAVIPIDAPPSRLHAATITGRLVLDEDRDGELEAAEPGLGGWEVTADLPDQPICFPESIKTVTTDTDGRFRFAGLVRGRWVLAPGVPENSSPKRWAVYSPDSGSFSDGENDWLAGMYADVSGADTADATVGIIPLDGTASISGVLYFDSDGSGVRDQGEPPVNGIDCAIVYRTPKGYSTILPNLFTGVADGRYEFSGLAAGDYMVGVISLSRTAVNPPAGANGFPESRVTLADGEERTGVDFGFKPPPANLPDEPTPEPATQPTLTPPPSATLVPPASGASASTGPVGAPNTGSDGASGAAGRGSVLAALLALGAAGALAAGSAFATRTRRR